MRYIALFTFFILTALTASAQYGTVTGRVFNKDSKNGLAKASIFLSNATVGTVSGDDGTFTLSGIRPGQYELVVTMVGYEDYTQTILVGKEPIKIQASMTPKVMELREVVITNGGNWKLNYANFIKDFIGTGDDAKKCKILNPTDLVLINHKTKKYLEGHSYDFLDIENRALGYKLRILLKEFKSDHLENVISWQGKVLFQELNGSADEKKKWQARREEIYYGSAMHFYRSLLASNLSEPGFEVRILQRAPNPQRAPEELIQKKLEKFTYAGPRDSLNFWREQSQMHRYIEQLMPQPVTPQDLIRQTEQPGVYALVFPGYLYVIYKKRMEKIDFADFYRPLDMPNYEASIITPYTQYALIDNNGVVISPHSVLYEGSWIMSKIAELLPVDYAPGDSKP
ncbi:carboxypeptidase-like regulatory domain-containing protein [Mucilaginibacter sp. RS28]|uniref:Carboxypeptidase-like regulatory domain-containing protein n=1 Tax=Mucilaginibacter straminoryzae TaxID=2932774 RepID=A0A9X2B9M6_9SPHI|nr:carboxypeptidase-like regulatory domain-containing protein [Mucilaginibacter straminoryzae]MCJ8209895.1 carboxypeptidase-like regulatory domain-containing protein [Mucilaginibacter straminoryzae]